MISILTRMLYTVQPQIKIVRHLQNKTWLISKSLVCHHDVPTVVVLHGTLFVRKSKWGSYQ